MQWPTQAGSNTTNLKVKIDFILPELSVKKIVTWNCHVDDSSKSRYYMNLGRYLLRYLLLNLKFYDNFIEAYDGTFKMSTTPMDDIVT